MGTVVLKLMAGFSPKFRQPVRCSWTVHLQVKKISCSWMTPRTTASGTCWWGLWARWVGSVTHTPRDPIPVQISAQRVDGVTQTSRSQSRRPVPAASATAARYIAISVSEHDTSLSVHEQVCVLSVFVCVLVLLSHSLPKIYCI